MAFPASTNVDGSNPGPNSASLPDPVTMAVGNLWKDGVFPLVITPTILTTGPAITVETFAATGIGLVVGDQVQVTYQGTQTANVGILDARVSATDTLEIKFLATTGTPTPAAGTAAVPYLVTVLRRLPNWAPGGSVQLDW
jgi:hypothetical protein